MDIQRFKCHTVFSDPHGSYVRFSDHAAELAEWKQRAERAEAYVAGQDVRSDFRNAGEMRAALDHYRDDLTATRAELARVVAECERREKEDADKLTLLRAECEAWRAFRKAQTDGLCSDVGDAIVATFRYAELLDAVDAARAATDAAGILKGAE